MSRASTLHKRANSSFSTSPRTHLEMDSLTGHAEDRDDETISPSSSPSSSKCPSSSDDRKSAVRDGGTSQDGEQFESERESVESEEDMAALLGRQDAISSRKRTGAGDDTWTQVKEIIIETAPTLLLTTVGLLFTGELLDHVSHWEAMRRIDELIIIIPVVLNLKGNLEMNLSSRLGTAANIGDLDDRTSRYSILCGNMALLQVQATLVSFIAACLSFLLGFITPTPDASQQPIGTAIGAIRLLSRRPRPKPIVDPSKPKSGLIEFVMVASTSMTSACLSSLILGSFMCTLVILCRYFSLNPDNIAPPVAACLGDLVTLCLLGLVSTGLISFVNTPLPLLLSVFLIGSAFACFLYVRRNRHVRDLLGQGWSPLFGAMAISSATGIILDLFVSRYKGFALLAIIISGLPGAVGSISVSRISTALHASTLSMLPTAHKYGISRDAGLGDGPSYKVVFWTLFAITLPVEVIFLSVLHSIGWLDLPIIFIAAAIAFFCLTVSLSLVFARYLTNFLWSRGRDPDMYAMPLHSSCIDLVGQLLLVLCFELVSLFSKSVEA